MIPSLLRARGPFRVFWAGQTLSLFGDQVTLVAVPLVAVLVLHADAAAMGSLVAAAWLPYLLFALPAGAWVDRRHGRRRVMVAADAGRAAVLLSVPAAAALHLLTMAHLYAAVFLSGTLSVFFRVAYDSLFQSMVARESYLQGQSLLNGSRAFSSVSGPPVAGLLVQAFSAPAALAVDAVTFLVSALSLAAIRPQEPEPAAGGRGHLLSGVRFIWGSPTMRASLLATATLNLFNLAYNALTVLYLVRYLHLAPALIGAVLGTGAVGGLAGAALTGRIGRRIGVGPAYVAGCFVFTAPLVLVPLAAGPLPLVLAMLVLAGLLAGFGVMLLDISVGAIFAALIPGQMRARVAGAYTVVNYGVRPVGALLGGALAAAVGVRQALFVVTVAAVAGALWLLPSPIPRLRDLPNVSGSS